MSVTLGVAVLYSLDDPVADMPTQSNRLLAALRTREHGRLGDSIVSVDTTARTVELLVTASGDTERDVVPAGRGAIEQARGGVAGLQLTPVGNALLPRPPGWAPTATISPGPAPGPTA